MSQDFFQVSGSVFLKLDEKKNFGKFVTLGFTYLYILNFYSNHLGFESGKAYLYMYNLVNLLSYQFKVSCKEFARMQLTSLV